MARNGQKLTAAFARTVTEPGKYHDDHGLILRVLPSGAKQWIWRGTVHGRRVDFGLGGYPYVTLAEAREAAFNNRKLARAGGDPLALKRRPNTPTFEQAAETVTAIHAAGWRDGGRSEKQWQSSLETYAMPRLGRKRVDEITTADVMAVLLADDFWNTRRETARRVRQRIGAVMKWAVAQGFRDDNPAGDAIAAALPRNGVARQHQRALPHSEVGAALARIRRSKDWPAARLALELLVLTACRSGEVRGARWEEFDLERRIWTIPAERTKSARAHAVPLSGRALEALDEARAIGGGGALVFRSKTGRPLRDAPLSRLCRENDIGCVPHGFRSSFRDWCSETGVAREVAEAALAHNLGDATERACAGSSMFDRRREVMEAWAGYVAEDGMRP